MALSLDRAAFINIITEGHGDIRRGHATTARRSVGHAAGSAEDAPGYDPDVQNNRAEARG